MPYFPEPKKKKWIAKVKSKAWTDSTFYNSRRWRAVRKNYIGGHPLCKFCKEKGLIKEGKVVDHIIPISQGGAEWNEKNFQTLCTSCHNRKSSKEAKERQSILNIKNKY